MSNNKIDKFSVLQNVLKLSNFHKVNVVHCDLKAQIVMLRVDDANRVGSSHARKKIGCSALVHDQWYRYIYHLNKRDMKYILHSPKRDGDGPPHKNIPQSFGTC